MANILVIIISCLTYYQISTCYSSPLLSLIPPSYIVASIRDQRNTTFSTLVITTSDSIMTLLAPVEMDIDVGNVDNYNEVREHTTYRTRAIRWEFPSYFTL